MDRTRPTARAAAAGSGQRAERQRVGVYGICEDAAGRILLVRAASHLTVARQWFLPGGGIDHGEEPVGALQREFAEETGLTVEAGDLLGVHSDVFGLPDGASLHTIRIIYGIRSHRGTLRDEVGGSSDAAAWVPIAEAWDLPLHPYVRRALTELR
ncbi:MAG: NUDIX hydrolase [Acidimicrobiales bacterium]